MPNRRCLDFFFLLVFFVFWKSSFKSSRMFLLLLAQGGFGNNLVAGFGMRAIRNSATTMETSAEVSPRLHSFVLN